MKVTHFQQQDGAVLDFFNLTHNPEKQGDQLFFILLIMVHILSTIFNHMVKCLYVSPISKSEFLLAPMQLNLK